MSSRAGQVRHLNTAALKIGADAAVDGLRLTKARRGLLLGDRRHVIGISRLDRILR